MWYTMPDSNRQYPMTIETVRKIKSMNLKGIKADDLEPADLTGQGKNKEVEHQFVDVVGQISLKTLERNVQKKRQRERPHPPQHKGRDPQQSKNRDQNRPPGNPPNRGPKR